MLPTNLTRFHQVTHSHEALYQQFLAGITVLRLSIAALVENREQKPRSNRATGLFSWAAGLHARPRVNAPIFEENGFQRLLDKR